ncbi:Spy/CpxP family protein refolding chaperone [Imhoffiella purpurea]|uniref:Zinc resistance-associated protein n=1 Tax=Imhoffiella purpurea TaxID=1249627 RepID=W9V2A3_9GAMM|nr:hypothetical protein [Imhoffiella purpurea]EXJ13444.1 hypothetical protein D779_3706 [Imhoffiella purpurea]
MKAKRIPAQIAFAMSGLLLGTALIGADTADARPDEGWRSGTDMDLAPRIERMTDRLDLSDDQKAQIGKIMEDARKAREQQRLEMRKRIEAVLTDEQKAKRASMLEDRLERRLERMADRLDLSEDQIAKMKALFEEQAKNPELTKADVREQISEILTDDQRAELRRPHHRPGRGDRGGRSERPDCG